MKKTPAASTANLTKRRLGLFSLIIIICEEFPCQAHDLPRILKESYSMSGNSIENSKSNHTSATLPATYLLNNQYFNIGRYAANSQNEIADNEQRTKTEVSNWSISPSPPPSNSTNNTGVVGPVDTDEITPPPHDNKHHQDRMMATNGRLEIAFQILNLVDLGETIYGIHSHRFHESNPLIGRHPSSLKLIALKSVASILHYTVYSTMRQDARGVRLFEFATIALQGGVVAYNATILF